MRTVMNFEMLKFLAQAYKEQKKRPPRLPGRVQTIKRAYNDICTGEDPWTGLGNFTNAWYSYAKHIRAELVSEPLVRPEQETEYTNHWAAFCAATVEFLCERYNVPCPDWVHDPLFNLAEPWYGTNENLRKYIKHIPPLAPSVQQHQRETAPPPFAKRNIFPGNRLFQNKYEIVEWMTEAIDLGMTNMGEIRDYARKKEISIHGG